MKLITDRAQRNYNYLEIIAKYNSFFERYGEDAELNQKQFKAFESALSSSLIGIDSVEEILNSLLSDENETGASLDLFVKDKDCYSFYKENKIMPVASREEALIVYSMIQNGDFDLFLNNELKTKILNNICSYFKNINETPVNLYDYIDYKGKSICADNLKDIQGYFTELKEAIENNSFIKISYNINDTVNEHIIQPVSFVYSQLDLRMRVRAFVSNGQLWTFYLSNIQKIETLNEAPFERCSLTEPKMKELVFSFENSKNRAERVAARFSDYKKTVKYNKNKNIITYRVFYPDDMTENNRIFFRLRSLGKGIEIKSEEKERVKADAKKALLNYIKG